MRVFKLILIVLTMLAFLISCDKDNPTGPNATYSTADMVGHWTGACVKGADTTRFNFTCNDTLALSGEGNNSEGRLVVRGKWTLSSDGKVTGGGYYGYFYGSNYANAWAEWSLQLSASKDKLTGTFDCAVSELFDSAAVSLSKQ